VVVRVAALIIGQVRLNDVPLPVPSDDAARALQTCTSSGSNRSSYLDAPALDGMLPIWNTRRQQKNDAFDLSDHKDISKTDADYGFSSVMCDAGSVSELVQLCIMANVSAINAVLLMHAPQPTPPLQLFPYIQACSPIIPVAATLLCMCNL
jgi:hypothetical protein